LIEGLSNAFVRVRGCVIPGRNQSRQSTGEVYLWGPSLACLAVDQAPQADPFVAPLMQITELSSFDSNPNYHQMNRVRGRVLHVADNLVYLTDSTNSLRVIPKSPPRLSAGDLVDAVGLPELGKPRLQSAVDWSQPQPVGTAAQDQKLVAQSQVLQQQLPTGFQSGHPQTDQDDQPTDHAAEDSGKCLGSPAFSDGMEFLPTTGIL
jgi:hypothetical protein